MTKRLTTIAASLAVASLMGFSVSASDTPSNTHDWANQAGKAINQVMSYPKVARNQGITGSASYKVTIDRDGHVVNYYPATSTGTKSLDNASERALKSASFPAIPASFSGDQLTFSLEMDYRQQVSVARQSYLENKGSVTGTRIALLSSSQALGK